MDVSSRPRFRCWLACAAYAAAACAAPAWAYDPDAPLLRPRTASIENSTLYLEEARDPRIFGYFDTGDHRFDEFISPQTNPIFFEDPRSLTEARFLYLRNSVASGLGAPGDFDYFGVQLRAAITHRVSLITTKAGFFCMGSDLDPDDGWANTNAGLKVGLWADAQRQQLLSLGALYEIPSGSGQALQGMGNGELAMFLTGGSQLGPRGNVLSAAGVRMPVNQSDAAKILYWSSHVDHALGATRVYAVGEMNWYHYFGSGDLPSGDAAGLDLFNFGNANAAGLEVITSAFGLRYKPLPTVEMGIVYELPMTEKKDILNNRLSADWITRY
jgi:hypothetical protein